LSSLHLFFVFCMGTVMAFGVNITDFQPYNEELEHKDVELLISYKIIADNHIATRERYNVSPVINPKAHEGYKIVKECVINAGDYRIMDDMPYLIATILRLQKDEVLECLYNNEVLITESTKGNANTITSRTRLEIAPTRVKARLVSQNIILQILAPMQVSLE